MLRADRRDPALAEVTARLDRTIEVPTRVLVGGKDMRRQMLDAQRRLFEGPYDWHEVEGTGHFLHRESPAAFEAALLAFLTE